MQHDDQMAWKLQLEEIFIQKLCIHCKIQVVVKMFPYHCITEAIVFISWRVDNINNIQWHTCDTYPKFVYSRSFFKFMLSSLLQITTVLSSEKSYFKKNCNHPMADKTAFTCIYKSTCTQVHRYLYTMHLYYISSILFIYL